MIKKWLRKKAKLKSADPERTLLLCAMFGAVEIHGVFGTLILFYQLLKSRRKNKHGN